MMVSEAQEFERRAREMFDGSPYVVSSTDDGFRVDIDVADAQWYGLYSKAGLKVAWRHDVSIMPGRFAITDRSSTVRWRAGVPSVSWSKATTAGTNVSFSRQRTWAFDERGDYRLT